MLAHVTAAALASENKGLAHPASVDSIPTSANKEDHVSMGVTAARKAARAVANTRRILAIELWPRPRPTTFCGRAGPRQRSNPIKATCAPRRPPGTPTGRRPPTPNASPSRSGRARWRPPLPPLAVVWSDAMSTTTEARARVVRAPRGTVLSCKAWPQEAALRMLMNNLDPEVAERPADLVVYGGIGRAARNWECWRHRRSLRGNRQRRDPARPVRRPVGIFRTHEGAPRVLISNSMLVPAWATWDHFYGFDRKGLMMYGQMTAAPGSTSGPRDPARDQRRSRPRRAAASAARFGARSP
jgi:hypothetical protein